MAQCASPSALAWGDNCGKRQPENQPLPWQFGRIQHEVKLKVCRINISNDSECRSEDLYRAAGSLRRSGICVVTEIVKSDHVQSTPR